MQYEQNTADIHFEHRLFLTFVSHAKIKQAEYASVVFW